jgi:hypothetical protein
MHPKYEVPRLEFVKHFLYHDGFGILYWRDDIRKGYRRLREGLIAGSLNTGDGYIYVMLNGYSYAAHLIIWLLETGHWPKDELDHVNGIRSDNHFDNLREASNVENAQNVAAKPRGKCGFGVSFRPYFSDNGKHYTVSKPYEVSISVHDPITGKRKRIFLGSFKTNEEAELVYLEAKAKHHQFSARIESVNQLRKGPEE